MRENAAVRAARRVAAEMGRLLLEATTPEGELVVNPVEYRMREVLAEAAREHLRREIGRT